MEIMDTQFIYIAGMAIPAVYIFMYLLGGALRPGYSHIINSVSELLSPGAPNKGVLMTIQIVYTRGLEGCWEIDRDIVLKKLEVSLRNTPGKKLLLII